MQTRLDASALNVHANPGTRHELFDEKPQDRIVTFHSNGILNCSIKKAAAASSPT